MKIEFHKLQAEIDEFAWNFKINNHIDGWIEEERLSKVEAMAKADNVDAQVFLAHTYLKGFHSLYAEKKFIQPDFETAAKWAAKASTAGNSMAWAILFILHFKGLGVPKDRVKAVKWLIKLAELGLPEAQTLLGECYYLGQGVKESNTEALKWFLKAANKEYYRAEFNIGELYENGHGVPINREEAQNWKKLSFEHGPKYPFAGKGPGEDDRF